MGNVVLQVTKQEEGWYCEYDSKVYPAMVRRYVMLAKCTDATAELNISIFNEQVRAYYLHRMPGTPDAFLQRFCPANSLRDPPGLCQSHCRGKALVEAMLQHAGYPRCSCAHRKCSTEVLCCTCRQSRCWG